MGLLQLFLSWVSRLVILLSVMLFSLMFVAKEGNIPLSRAFLRIAHLLSFSAWLGASVWVSFIAGVVLIQAVDLETFGRAQAKLFDAFFKFSALCLAAQGFSSAGLVAHGPPTDGDGAGGMRATPFWIAVACVVANLVFFGPQTTISFQERQRLCKELGVDRSSPLPEVRKLKKRFGMFHGICNLLNLAALGCGFVHASTLASRLKL